MVSTINGAVKRLRDSLPDAVKAKALRAVSDAEALRWDSGDLCAELIDESPIDPLKNVPYSKTAIRMCVADLYHTVESTIRSREYVCRIVTEGMRERYPWMSYEYWRACCGAEPDDNQSKSEAVEGMAVQVNEYYLAYGDLPGVATVRSWTSEGEVRMVYIQRVESILSSIDKVIEDEQAPSRLRGLLRFSRRLILSYLSSEKIVQRNSSDNNTNTDE